MIAGMLPIKEKNRALVKIREPARAVELRPISFAAQVASVQTAPISGSSLPPPSTLPLLRPRPTPLLLPPLGTPDSLPSRPRLPHRSPTSSTRPESFRRDPGPLEQTCGGTCWCCYCTFTHSSSANRVGRGVGRITSAVSGMGQRRRRKGGAGHDDLARQSCLSVPFA